MVKRRKTKSNKFARMNEEERAQYIQHRAEFELEAKRRKQQLIAIYTKVLMRLLNIMLHKSVHFFIITFLTLNYYRIS